MIAFVGVGFNDCQNETKSFRQRIIFSGNKSSKAFEFRFFNLLFLFQGSNRTHLLDLSQSKTLLGYFFYIKYGEMNDKIIIHFILYHQKIKFWNFLLRHTRSSFIFKPFLNFFKSFLYWFLCRYYSIMQSTRSSFIIFFLSVLL